MKNFTQKKFLLIFPPLWTINMPHLALPTLIAQLKNNGFSAKGMDLNIEFFNFLLDKKYISKCIKKIEDTYLFLNQNKSFLGKEDTLENKILNYKYDKLKEVFENNININKFAEYSSKLILELEKLKLKYTDDDFERLSLIKYSLNKIIYVCSLAFLPTYIDRRFEYQNGFMSLNLNDIKNVIFDESQNIFLDFYKSKIKEIQEQNYSYIGISIGAGSQLISGLTIANLLRKETNAHINIGGGFFSRVTDGLLKNPDFFDFFAHSVSYGEGELSIVELAKYINDQIPIENVHNLIYKKDKNIIINGESKPVILSRISNPDYSDYDLGKYYYPQRIIPLQTNRGCYWRKCAFCSHSYGKTYTVKKIDDLINEIAQNKLKYNVVSYDIIDEAIHPNFLDRFSDALIENKLNINFIINSRFEKEITSELLNKAYKAGLRTIRWGFETGNKRIFNLMNKGVVFEKREQILKMAYEAGIRNVVFAIYGFPTEKYEEALDTLTFLEKNHKYIQSTSFGEFCLTVKSPIILNPSDYGIVVSYNFDDFSIIRRYTEKNGLSEEEKQKLKIKFKDILHKYYYNTPKIFNKK